MTLLLASAAVLTTMAFVYWYMNKDKPIQHILSELGSNITMQSAGAGGLIDDWVNIRRNRFVVPDAKRKVAVITGGARGIGTEVIRGLLKANAIVVMGIRKPETAQKLAETMENRENLHWFRLDLQSLQSVKEFAKNVLQKFPKINILVNNAGIMYGDYNFTEDGFEPQLAANHLGHFYLTHLLLPGLKKGGSNEDFSRIVNVSSCAHFHGTVDFEDINYKKKHYDTTAAYAQSKLAQILCTRHINKLLEEEGCPVRCYAVHPGMVNTDLFKGTAIQTFFSQAMKIFFKTPEKGATSILYGCFDKELDNKGGLYISNCREGISNRFSKISDNQLKMFDLSCNLIGINNQLFGTTLD